MLADYIRIARPDHWFKNVMILPGFLIAIMVSGVNWTDKLYPLVWGSVAVCLVASSNYVLNDWLDAVFDRHHPVKRDRPMVIRSLSKTVVYVEYAGLGLCGLLFGWLVSGYFVFALLALWLQGVFYNVRPLRTKEVAYLDVLSESINNPIRLFLGWFIVTSQNLPPFSLVISYWMGGAFLMAVKRYAEYNFIDNREMAANYRRSFAVYNEKSLIVSAFFYGAFSALFFGIFTALHCLELIFSLPFLALLFTWYLHLGMLDNSPAQRPEKLYREKAFLIYLLLLVVVMGVLLWIELPFLGNLLLNVF